MNRRPRFHWPWYMHLLAALHLIELAAPVNSKGGALLRNYVSRLAHSPVYGMEIVDSEWWAHTERGWWPVSWYVTEARRELTHTFDLEARRVMRRDHLLRLFRRRRFLS